MGGEARAALDFPVENFSSPDAEATWTLFKWHTEGLVKRMCVGLGEPLLFQCSHCPEFTKVWQIVIGCLIFRLSSRSVYLITDNLQQISVLWEGPPSPSSQLQNTLRLHTWSDKAVVTHQLSGSSSCALGFSTNDTSILSRFGLCVLTCIYSTMASLFGVRVFLINGSWKPVTGQSWHIMLFL